MKPIGGLMIHQLAMPTTNQGGRMSKAESLELIKLLSALESWAFSTQAKFPEYLVERIELALDKLTDGVLMDGDECQK